MGHEHSKAIATLDVVLDQTQFPSRHHFPNWFIAGKIDPNDRQFTVRP